MINLLFFVLALFLFALLVIGHEFGHYLLAKRNGIRVDEFGLGFPPRIGKGRQVGETLYTINWIPLGGFVRLAEEDGTSKKKGSFAAARLGVKAKVLLAGVGMNLLMAIVIFYGLCVIGLPGLGSPFEPSFLHPSYAQPKQLLLTQVEPGSPAASIGLKKDDYVLKANGQTLTTVQQLENFTSAHARQMVTLEIRHDGQLARREVTLRAPNPNGILGVSPQQVYKLRYNPLQAIIAALWITGALFVATIVAIFELIIHIPSLITDLFGSSVPAAAQDASGPVGIVYILTSLGGLGVSYVWLFIANISVALAAFNVLPLPALDGGRLAVAVVRRFRKKSISAESEGLYHTIGFFALIALVIIISIYDFRKF